MSWWACHGVVWYVAEGPGGRSDQLDSTVAIQISQPVGQGRLIKMLLYCFWAF